MASLFNWLGERYKIEDLIAFAKKQGCSDS